MSTVQDKESTIGEGNHASHHAAGRLEKESSLGTRGGGYFYTHHTFDGPLRFRGLWLDANTVIERLLELEDVRTTAEEDLQWISVRVVLREER